MEILVKGVCRLQRYLMHKYQKYKIISIRSLLECMFPYIPDKFSVLANLSDKKCYFNLHFYDLLLFVLLCFVFYELPVCIHGYIFLLICK